MKHNKKALILRITCILLFSLALAPLQVASKDKATKVREIATLKGHSSSTLSVVFSPDGKLLACGKKDGTVELWDVMRKREVATLHGHQLAVQSVDFSPDGRTIVSGSYDKRVKLWDVDKRTAIADLQDQNKWWRVYSVSFSPDGHLIASGSEDNAIRIWDTIVKKNIATLKGHSGWVRSVAFSPDGSLIASASADKTVKLWNVDERKLITTFDGHTREVTVVAFSSDGKLIASGSWDKTVMIRDISGQKTTTLRGHNDWIWALAFSPDGKLLASGSSDGIVKLWDIELKQEIAMLKAHHGVVWSLAFSPDGKMLASGSEDNTIKLWDVSPIASPLFVHNTSDSGGVNNLPPKPKFNPNLRVSTSFTESSGNNILEEGETASISFVVHNSGRGEAYNLQPVLKFPVSQSRAGLSLGESEPLIRLDPGDSSVLVATLVGDERVVDQTVEVLAQVLEANGFDSDPVILRFQTRATRPPKLEIAEWAIDDDSQGESQGNGNRQFELGEIAEVTLRMTNSGEGSTKDAKLRLSLPRDPNVFYQSASSVFELGDLPPRASKDITFAISTNKRFSGDSIELLVQFIDARSRLNSESYFQLPMKQMSAPLAAPINIVPITVLPATVEVLPALTSLVDTDIPTTGMRNPDAVAVVIGNYQYAARDIPPVPYAQGDAAIMKEYLVKALGYDEGNILYVENATKARMEALFGTDTDFKGRVYSYIKSGKSDLFVYYSGHGAPDIASGKSYFVPSDCDPTLVRLGGYSLETFYKNLSQLATKKTWVVIDACFSGASQEGTLIKGASPIYIELEGSEKLLKNGTVFSSAKGEQVASWYPEKKHGLFTYFFLKGLQGSADSDGDEVITTSEMESYITDNVSGVPYMARRLWQREQLPIVTADDKNEVLLELK